MLVRSRSNRNFSAEPIVANSTVGLATMNNDNSIDLDFITISSDLQSDGVPVFSTTAPAISRRSSITFRILEAACRMALLSLMNENLQARNHETTLDATGLTNGVYFYRLDAIGPSSSSAGSFSATKKLLLQR
jgi:hypothetical protein